jgi:hypothetical protein
MVVAVDMNLRPPNWWFVKKEVERKPDGAGQVSSDRQESAEMRERSAAGDLRMTAEIRAAYFLFQAGCRLVEPCPWDRALGDRMV